MRPPARRPHGDPEALPIYGLLTVVGAIPVILAIAQDTSFGTEATLGVAMSIAGLVGIFTRWRRRPPTE